MPLTSGTRLGPYEILAPIGKGGMGEVYQANDTRLDRTVAIKVLPEHLAESPERKARFEREAKAISQLNHPHICTLYDVGEQDGIDYLVMEYIEGETLAERIARGPIPIEEAIPLFIQIAEGLEAAHEKAIVHRDLKPANVKIGPNGKPKILDFGLAKAFVGGESAADSSQSPTLTKGTALGAIMGTTFYMSPEQAQGMTVDARTDVWAFGCVLYEALSGRKVFEGASVTETLAEVLKNDPDWDVLPDAVPMSVRNLLTRCLTKDRKWRLQHVGEARIALHDAMNDRGGEESAKAPLARSGRTPWLVAAAMAAVAAAAWLSPREPVPSPALRAVIPVTPAERLASPIGGYYKGILAISPDGTRLVFSGEKDGVDVLYVREMDGFDARPLPGTSGAYRPFFSPDGRHIAFFSNGKLRRVALDGGNPRIVANIVEVAHGGSWGDDDTIVFEPRSDSGLLRVSADGGPVEVLTVPDPEQNEQGHQNPSFLPGGREILFNVAVAGRRTGEGRVMYLSLETGELEMLVDNGHYPRYATSGHIVYATRDALMAAPFDRSSVELTGPSRPVIEDILSTPQYGARHFDVSRTGTLVYVGGGAINTSRRLVWVDRDGSKDNVPAATGPYLIPRISPSGRYISVQARGADDDVWLYDLRRGAMTRQTFEGENYTPVWGPDETQLAVSYTDRGVANLHLLELGGTGARERLLDSEYTQFPTSWSADGRLIAYNQLHPETGLDLWILSLEEERVPRPFRVTDFDESHAVFSPDSKWLAYTSNETGRAEVFVESVSGSEREQVSTDGGSAPVWSKISEELFYRHGNQTMVVSIELDPALELGAPRRLFVREAPRADFLGALYDVGADGRFLFLEPVEPFDAAEINVVVNWFEELERLVPTDN